MKNLFFVFLITSMTMGASSCQENRVGEPGNLRAHELYDATYYLNQEELKENPEVKPGTTRLGLPETTPKKESE